MSYISSYHGVKNGFSSMRTQEEIHSSNCVMGHDAMLV